jgi:hypothetical protein
MNLFMAIYCAILFFLLSPGILFRLPISGSKFVVTGAHAVLFGLVTFLTCKFVWNLSQRFGFGKMKEGLDEDKKKATGGSFAQ